MKNFKWLALALMLTLSLTIVGGPMAFADPGVTVVIDGQELPAQGQVIDEQTLVPLRAIGDALNYQINWDEANSTVVLTKAPSLSRPDVVSSPDAAKQLLLAGNERFVSGQFATIDRSEARRDYLAKGQKPFAVVVSCSDSRVPPELIFDQGLGDLFVVRVAGNVIDKDELGSVEYAVEHLHAPLVVVLGHEKCGAVQATIAGGAAPGSIGDILKKIQPAVDKAKSTGATGDALVNASIIENVHNTMNALNTSPVLQELSHEGKLQVLGAEYNFNGKISWLDAAGAHHEEAVGGEKSTVFYKVIGEKTAEEVNQWWLDNAGYTNPPYEPGTMVQEIELTATSTFARVYDGETSKIYGGWVMESQSITGLTPAEIQNLFALPALPKYQADVILQPGTKMRKGIANAVPGWGEGGGVQFDLMGQRVGEFVNPRELPGAAQ